MEKDWEKEQQYFRECRELIAENVKKYEAELEERHAKTQELYKALQSGDVELYNQLMTSTSLEEHTANQLRKNKTAYQNPYFGRIDYLDKEMDKESLVYIGKNGVFKDRIEVVVADWRAPISSVYYENEMGEGFYKLPDGKEQTIVLHLKRTYDIADGSLNGYYDSDTAANDALLIKYLSQNKEAVLGDIIATIQKEQNVIIRESPFINILVQGVAGSGKTTVAMHRISYILYNYKERFTSNEFCIIGGNELLLSYITSGLPELDVHDVKQKCMDAMFTHLLKKEWTKKHTVTEVLPDAKVRSRMDFMLKLELFLLHLREEKVDCSELRDRELGVILTGSSMERFVGENPEYSIYRLLVTLDERVRTRLKFLCPEGEKEYLREKYREYKDYYKNQAESRSIYALYAAFLADYERQQPGSLDLAAHERNAAVKSYDIYDLAALLLIYYRVKQKKEDMEFGQIFIDEAQDFGITPYYVLRKVLPACYFTIMGDVSQNINYETGMNDWEDMRKWVLTGERDSFKLLQKSYRNTIEISEYAGKVLEKAAGSAYRIHPVIRHGIPVQEYELTKEEEMYKKARALIEDIKGKGYESVAVVCNDVKEARWVEKWMEEATVLPVQLVKGLEFDAVLLWNPKRIEEIENKARAKLFYVACTRALHELHLLRLRV